MTEVTLYEFIAKAMTEIPIVDQELSAMGGPMSEAMRTHLEHSSLQDIFDSNLAAILSLPGHHPAYTLSYEEDAVTPVFTWQKHEPGYWIAALEYVLSAKLKKMGLDL